VGEWPKCLGLALCPIVASYLGLGVASTKDCLWLGWKLLARSEFPWTNVLKR
jgi:hypothetical protein